MLMFEDSAKMIWKTCDAQVECGTESFLPGSN